MKLRSHCHVVRGRGRFISQIGTLVVVTGPEQVDRSYASTAPKRQAKACLQRAPLLAEGIPQVGSLELVA